MAEARLFVNLHTLDYKDQALMSGDEPLSTFAHNVVLEITERASLDHIKALPARLQKLRDMGYRLPWTIPAPATRA